MISLLLTIIYIAFISLGLPDSLLGAAWPVMSHDFNVPLSYAGIVSMIVAGATIVSSLSSNRLTRKFGPGLVTACSVCLTAIALIGFSFAPSFIVICIFALPYGFGAGGVDAALNNYVAIHFKARHMSWLHCFWGVGASVSPYIMGRFLVSPQGWHGGYGCVGIIQIVLTAILFFSLPLWKKVGKNVEGDPAPGARPTDSISKSEEGVPAQGACHTGSISSSAEGVPQKSAPSNNITLLKALKIKGVPSILLAFFAYCGLETTAGLWASTYLANYRGIEVHIAAQFASLFYFGITVGRLISGFISEKIGDKRLIRGGIIIVAIGVIMVMISKASNIIALAGLIIIGFGCAPIFPSILHATPVNFGPENSQAIIGIQMASAYLGSTFIPPLFGALASSSFCSLGIYPFYLFFFVIIIILGSENLNRIIKNQKTGAKAGR